MSEFVEALSHNLKLPVLDRTSLKGSFTFTLRWNTDQADALGHDEAAAVLRREVSAAISQQLGLTLKFRKMPLDVLIIDSAEKPSSMEN